MIQFQGMTAEEFLRDYWQKKPLLIKKALPDFVPPIDADELAGLALEEDVESRLVMETPHKKPFWELRHGPFDVHDFSKLPETHWTLLVQGVDLLVPEVAKLREHFNFIPQWRFDDVMISYAATHGGVGPHYDNYDVFLYQAAGSRRWLLTTKDCHPENHINDVPLRLMQRFEVEFDYVLEAGDMLYLPPHVGHHGIALNQDCMTYSFGYRSYQGRELFDSFADYLAEEDNREILYRDPNWSKVMGQETIEPDAWQQAKAVLLNMLADDRHLKRWFSRHVTTLDRQAQQHLPQPLSNSKKNNVTSFLLKCQQHTQLRLHAACRISYYFEHDDMVLMINGCSWDTNGVTHEMMLSLANARMLETSGLSPWLHTIENQTFLHQLWLLQWVYFD